MDPSIKQHLLIRPLILAGLGIPVGIAFPHLASTLIAMITERGFFTNAGESFSGLTYLICVALFTSIGLWKFIQNKQLINDAENGICPACPKCGFPMLQRNDEHDTINKRKIWGCSRFPECDGRREIT